LEKLPELSEKIKIIVNDTEVLLDKFAMVNGVPQLTSYQIQNKDDIEIRGWYTVQQIAQLADIALDGTVTILVNDVPANSETKVYHDFTVKFVPRTEEDEPAEDLEATEEWTDESEPAEEVGTDAKTEENPANSQEEASVTVQSNTNDCMVVMVNKQPIVMRGKDEYIFVDVFDYINFDLREAGGRNIITLLNGRQAQYMETLSEGDIIDIYWEN